MKMSKRAFMVSSLLYGVRLVSRHVGSFVIGSTCAHLSFGAALTPLAGFYGGTASALSLGLVAFIIHWLLQGSFSLGVLALYIPGIVGGLFFSSSSRLLKVFFFCSAMALFWVHPVGQQAFLYPLLWVVPLMLVCTRTLSWFAQALVSTFAVHAVGACIWLYTVPMTPVLWHGMIPLVVVERLVNALLMTVVMYSVVWVQKTMRIALRNSVTVS